MVPVITRRSIVASLALSAGLITAPTSAQSWAFPASGNWSTPGNWSGSVVPNSSSITATFGLAGPYTVTVDGSFTAGNLLISNPQARLEVLHNRTLYLGGGAGFTSSSNSGTIVINPAAIQNTTQLAFNAAHALGGSGRITLNANQNDLNSARIVRNAGGVSLTNAVGHTIDGGGRIYDVAVVNDGVVDANVGAAVLEFLGSAGHINTGQMRASAGILQFNSCAVSQSGAGVISASGSGVAQFVNSTVNGGAMATSGQGVVQIPPSNSSWFNDLTNSGQFIVWHNSTMGVGGSSFTNTGVVTVNPSAIQNTTQLQVTTDGPVAFNGNGTIILNATQADLNSARIVRAAASSSVVLGPSATLRGTGRVYDIVLSNNGLVQSDQQGSTLEFLGRSCTNNATMRAVNGAVLQFNSQTTAQSGSGQLIADGTGSIVNLFAGLLSGGTVRATNGGLVQLPPGNGFTLDGVNIVGPFAVYHNSLLALGAGSVNITGVLTLNPQAVQNTTSLRIDPDGNLNLAGTGSIVLNANGDDLNSARIVRNAANSAFTVPPSLTIRGSGRIYDIGFTNNGLIDADEPGRWIELLFRGSTNNALIRARNGGLLQLNTHSMAQGASGQLVADGAGSLLNLVNGQVSGGAIAVQNGAVGQVGVGTGFTLDGVTLVGPFNLMRNSLLAIGPNSITVAGTLTINPEAVQNTTTLRFDLDGNITLAGGGSIVLNADPDDLNSARIVRSAANSAFTIPAGLTLRGSGRTSDIGFTNNGLIQSDLAGRWMEFYFRSSNNNSVIRAVSGGLLQLNSHVLNQSVGGQLTADGAGSLINLVNGAVYGGTINAANGGIVQVGIGTGFTLDNVTINGPFNLGRNSLLAIGPGGITVNGLLTINAEGINNTTSLRADADANTTLAGTGTIRLNASPDDLNSARIIRSANNSALTFGQGLTLSGRGRFSDIAITIAGTLSPGDANTFANIDAWYRPITFTSTGRYAAKVGRSGANLACDQITGNSAVNIDGGTLSVSVMPGYVPVRGDRFDIILAGTRTGRFTTVQLPPSSTGVWKYAYLPNGVRVGFACNPADPAGLGGTLGPDGGFTPDDLIVFLDGFFNGDLALADVAGLGGTIGGDGRLTVDDIIVFLGAFFAGCQQ